MRIYSINLSDRSYYSCDSKHSLNLKYANTLTSGQPYYYRYGMSYQAKLDKATSASGFKFVNLNCVIKN